MPYDVVSNAVKLLSSTPSAWRTAIDASVLSRVAWVLGNPGRCRVLLRIAECPGITTRELAEQTGIDRSYVYQHVRRLKQLRWIAPARRGVSIVYSCTDPDVRSMVLALRDIAAGSPPGDASAQADDTDAVDRRMSPIAKHGQR